MNSQQAINLLKNAEQYLDEYCELNDEVKAAFCMARTALELFENSEQLPYAQPEIVRCKDCKHWDTTWQNDWAKNYHYCPITDGTHRGGWYCADAERREG